jgi:hypothetical protein
MGRAFWANVGKDDVESSNPAAEQRTRARRKGRVEKDIRGSLL